MIKPVSKSKPLFCEQYWQNIIKKTRLNEEHKTHVSGSLVHFINNRLDTSGHDYIHDINKYFINGLPKKSIENLNVPLYQFIAQTDKEFKELAPTKEPMILWRGVSTPEKKQEDILDLNKHITVKPAILCICLNMRTLPTKKISH